MRCADKTRSPEGRLKLEEVNARLREMEGRPNSSPRNHGQPTYLKV
jgi:hypothetical protein